jgi:pimeloyl-ACP methyl ester carboxylesterase
MQKEYNSGAIIVMNQKVAAGLCAAVIAVGASIAALPPQRPRPVTPRYHPVMPTPEIIAADPIDHLKTLPPIPALLIYDSRDPVVPPAENAMAAQRDLGRSCRSLVFDGAEHVDPRIFNPDTAAKFLQAHAPAGTTIVLLHGWGMKGEGWFTPNPAVIGDRDSRTVAAFGSALDKRFPCKTGDFAGDAWGSDAAVRELERLTAHDRRVALVGCSMGAALMWRYTLKHPHKVVALIGLSPVCSLRSMCRMHYGSDIARAYGEQHP